MSRYKINISSKFKEMWRYNIVVIYELCTRDGQRIEYKAEEKFVASVGSNLAKAPIGHIPFREINLESGEGDYLNLLVYIIPHTLPASNDIYTTKPFPLVVKVERNGEAVVNQVFEVNQWSGDNISLERVGTSDK